ncbi:Uma2 family endonuclease [Thermoleptolyngbya sichuanensis XZ-Cy5]|uniref:Uma2 family endonuclease n=1 Tax=Thermoleptolyngbya sichuanensis TaxID=2885951 RepID=UPI00240E6951|nr:Uma2 family endonuclease [Thermoleptolyngbya sichuanensis]MDG2615102.1 Uma2 family endonuclease [Thermoleptolyngbya sichuanensis XZ-Cy5]
MSIAKDLDGQGLEPATAPRTASSNLPSPEPAWAAGIDSGLDLDKVPFPPGDLYSDEPPLESELHLRQILLLIQSLEWLWRGPDPSTHRDFYAFGNLTIYYSLRERKSEDFRGPDFFVVLGADPKPRKSWVVWEEGGKYPNVIIELLSDSTAHVDRGLKKQLYQDTFRTPDYFWFDPHTLEFCGFHLLDGRYQPLEPDSRGWLWSEQLQLFLGIQDRKLRFFTPDGQLVPIPEEATAIERQRAEEERQRAEEERLRAEQAEALLAQYRARFGELPSE